MKTWLIGGSAIALLAAGWFLTAKRSEPASSPPAPEVAAVVPAPAAVLPLPVVLDRVVDVTDIEHLLEPPPIPAAVPAEPGPVITRVGYDEPAAPVASGAGATPIPLARE